jgi:hypothetical protein
MREQRGPMVVLIALLAFLGIRALPFGSAPESPGESRIGKAAPPNPEAKEAKRAGPPEGASRDTDFYQPLLDFHNTRTPGKGKNEYRPWECPDFPGWELEFLIALVPDPSDSTSGNRFDALIDAIQRAVETQGYVLDRFYYPWPRQGAAKTDEPPSPDAPDYALRLGPWEAPPLLRMTGLPKKPERLRAYERQPGALLFRRTKTESGDSKDQRLLLVLLVGETAMAGIHKLALTAGLNLVGKSKHYDPKSGEYDPCKPIRILGPYHSGSQASLARTINR